MSNLEEQLGIDMNDPATQLAQKLVKGRHDLIKDLREAREKQGLTHKEVADKMGTSEYSIAFFEQLSNNPTLSDISKYALAIGVNVNYFVEIPEENEVN